MMVFNPFEFEVVFTSVLVLLSLADTNDDVHATAVDDDSEIDDVAEDEAVVTLAAAVAAAAALDISFGNK